MRRLSSDQVTQITTLLNDGKSTREIAKILGCGKTTVEKYRKMTVNEPAELKQGRPQKLTSRDMKGYNNTMKQRYEVQILFIFYIGKKLSYMIW